ncbi:MAG: hypothetical protein R3B36_05255 [Polyangiaceae bacterium]
MQVTPARILFGAVALTCILHTPALAQPAPAPTPGQPAPIPYTIEPAPGAVPPPAPGAVPPPPAPTYAPAPAPTYAPAPAPTYAPAPAQPAPQAAAPSAAPAAAEDDDGPSKPSLKLELGGSLRRLHDFGVTGLDWRFGVGAQNKAFGHYATVGGLWGATSERLRTCSVMAGYNFDFRFVEVLRLGVGLELGYLWVRRASVDTRMFALGAGGYFHLSADLAPLDKEGRRALYVDVRMQASIHYEDAVYWGPSALVGLRL